jgi:hypothetical protein
LIHIDTIPVPPRGARLVNQHGTYQLAPRKGPSQQLNATAALLWSLCDGRRSIGEIEQTLRNEFPTSGHALTVDMIDGIRALSDGGLLKLGVSPPAASLSSADLCILFVYHRDDAVSRRHLDQLTYLNPEDAVVPVTVNADRHLAGAPTTSDIRDCPTPWPLAQPWRSLDAVLYTWFLHRRVPARRYVLIEYDCLCTLPIREAYRGVWDAELAARDWFTRETNPDWPWFQELGQMEQRDQRHAAGVVPFAGLFASSDALGGIAHAAPHADVFGELRFGTTARRLGIPVEEFPEPLRTGINWFERPLRLDQPGIFHPIKQVR